MFPVPLVTGGILGIWRIFVVSREQVGNPVLSHLVAQQPRGFDPLFSIRPAGTLLHATKSESEGVSKTHVTYVT